MTRSHICGLHTLRRGFSPVPDITKYVATWTISVHHDDNLFIKEMATAKLLIRLAACSVVLTTASACSVLLAGRNVFVNTAALSSLSSLSN